jgi:glycosyltransferase involved in cell wall biosynthesis
MKMAPGLRRADGPAQGISKNDRRMTKDRSHMDFSIVVPAYNEEISLPDTLKHLNRIVHQIPRNGEVIVTNNNSTDRTEEIAKENGAVVVFEGHRQIARSRNAGASISRAKYLFFVDADTVISKKLFKTSLNLLETGSVCGGGALARFAPGTSRDRLLELLVGFWDFLSRTFKWSCGAYVFCRRDAFDEIGGFDERFYASEEIHFSRSLKIWGKKHKKQFVILDQYIETSPRKLQWFGIWRLLKMNLPVMLFPYLLRSRRFCSMWYTRPKSEKPKLGKR